MTDPYVQAPDMPQNLNRYSYVLNNPVNLVDPSGHYFWAIFALVAAVMEAVAAETITVAVLQTLAGKVIAISFAASLQQLPMKAITQAELNHIVSNQQLGNVQKVQPQQQNRLSQYPTGGEDPNARPWWQRLNEWCIVCDVEAAGKDDVPANSAIVNGAQWRPPNELESRLETLLNRHQKVAIRRSIGNLETCARN